MAADDVKPTRLAAAVRAADTLIGELPSKAAVGAVAFSSSQPPTAERTNPSDTELSVAFSCGSEVPV